MKEINNDKENNNEVKEISFAKYIINLRLKRNLTQKALAEKIQVSDRTISKWENGLTVPDLINIRNICKELGVSANSVVLEKRTLLDRFKDFLRLLKIFWKHLYNNIFKLIFAILFILLIIYFINNYNSVSVYLLNYDSSSITIDKGYFIKTKIDTILMIDNIELNKDYDSEIDTLELELYILMNGDKVTIYKDNELGDIFIEELTRYPETFTSDITREMTKGLYLTITINNEETYDCKISFRKNFSNNKLVYSKSYIETDYNSDYKIFLGHEENIILDKYYNNLNPSNVTSFDDVTTDTASYSVTNDDNKLKDLGYSYDKDSDTYTKVDGDKTITYQPKFDLLISKEMVNDNEHDIYYYIEKDRIDFKIFDVNGDINYRFKYFINQKELKCKIGNCQNYQKEIDYILAEYQAISETL